MERQEECPWTIIRLDLLIKAEEKGHFNSRDILPLETSLQATECMVIVNLKILVAMCSDGVSFAHTRLSLWLLGLSRECSIWEFQ